MAKLRSVLLAGAATSLLVAGEDLRTEPCCTSCPAGQVKYYSVPHPEGSNPQCGECCLNPHFYWLWKLFEPKLMLGGCTSKGFAKYVSTEADGVWPLKVTSDRYVQAEETKTRVCPDKLEAVYADMHDGDMKKITIDRRSLTIEPSGNNQTWVVNAELDVETCSAAVDFHVAGKPNPPPVSLTATLWWSFSAVTKKTVFEFTDPTGKLAARDFPLNRWVELKKAAGQPLAVPCPSSLHHVYADMHDGDKKAVDITGSSTGLSMTVTPSGNDQKWRVGARVDPASCSASVDFNVEGKPSPPPVSLQAILLYSVSAAGGKKTELEFTDPSGTLAAADFPLNNWVQIAPESPALVV